CCCLETTSSTCPARHSRTKFLSITPTIAPTTRGSDLKNAEMIQSRLREKAARDNRGLHSAVQLIAIALTWLLLAGLAAAQPQTKSESGSNNLRGGWYPWDPYQYRDYKRGVPVLTGCDVEIERALARIMAIEIDLPEIAWKDHLAALITGTADIAAGATASE